MCRLRKPSSGEATSSTEPDDSQQGGFVCWSSSRCKYCHWSVAFSITHNGKLCCVLILEFNRPVEPTTAAVVAENDVRAGDEDVTANDDAAVSELTSLLTSDEHEQPAGVAHSGPQLTQAEVEAAMKQVRAAATDV